MPGDAAPILLVVASLAARALGQGPPVYPGAGWARRTPEQEGMSSARLNEALDYAGGPAGLRSHCVTVHRNGALVAERYWDRPLQPPATANSTTMVYSISKAIATTLIGMAERNGAVHTEQHLPEVGIPQFAGTEAGEITIDMLLRHDSGREYHNDIEDIAIPQFAPAGTDPSQQTEHSIGLSQQHRPGTHLQYNQMAFQLLERVLCNITAGEPVPSIADRFFEALQFESQTFWQTEGVVTGIPNGPLLYAGVHTSCRDLARFGTLWMHRGSWGRAHSNGTNTTEQFFSTEFWDKAMSVGPRNARPYHWFQSGDTYRADGMGGQFVSFSSGAGLVITRIGHVLDEWVESFSPSTMIALVVSAITDLDEQSRAKLFDQAASLADESAGEASVSRPPAEERVMMELAQRGRRQRQ
jgi:CubicO group peptidase (beta-lactamase class C family)